MGTLRRGIHRARKALRQRFAEVFTYSDTWLLRRPDELFLCMLAVVSALPTLFGQAPASLTEALIWEPLRVGWALTLVILACTIAYTSFRYKDPISAAIRLRNASILLGITSSVYAVALIAFAGVDGAIAAGAVLSYAVVRFWRAVELHYWLKALLIT